LTFIYQVHREDPEGSEGDDAISPNSTELLRPAAGGTRNDRHARSADPTDPHTAPSAGVWPEVTLRRSEVRSWRLAYEPGGTSSR